MSFLFFFLFGGEKSGLFPPPYLAQPTMHVAQYMGLPAGPTSPPLVGVQRRKGKPFSHPLLKENTSWKNAFVSELKE